MQKVINVLAVASFAVSAAIVGAGGYVYVNKDAIIDGVKDQAAGLIGDAVGGAVSGAVGDLPGLLGGGDAPSAGGGLPSGLPSGLPF